MSAQEKTGLPKHLQHQRLKREEDEEQWISGEELNTEGSSDEEAEKKDLKKIKWKTTPKKEAAKIKPAGGDTNLDVPENLEETLIQWRPKRGSIKLPTDEVNYISKSGNFNVRLEKWDILDNFDKTRENLEKLKSGFHNSLPPIFDTENYSLESDEHEFTLRQSIETLENDLRCILEYFKNNKAERLKYETKICEELKIFNLNPIEYLKNIKFYEICKFDDQCDHIDEENMAKLLEIKEIEIIEESDEVYDEFDLKNIEIIQTDNEGNRKFKTKKENNKSADDLRSKMYKEKIDFIANEKKKLLNFTMTGCPMTDEEKFRLNNLLSDLNDETSDNDAINNCLKYENGFKSNEEEKQNLEDIEKKLKILEENSEKGHHLFEITTNTYQEFSRNNEEKLKEIDQKLEKIKSENN